MKHIIVFAGTTEGREIAEALAKRRTETDIFVVSEYGRELLPKSEYLHIHVGRLEEADMEAAFRQLQPDLILDATHPYAANVTRNIHTAARNTGFLYRRVYRKNGRNKTSDNLIEVSDTEAAVEYLEQRTGNIFVTTGSKELAAFTKLTDCQNRVYARVLPSVRAAEICEACGVKGRHLMMMQGPFSREMNELMLKETNAAYLVTKNSGRAGGFEEKCEAALGCGVKIVLIGRPEEHLNENEVIGVEDALKMVDIKYQKKKIDTENDRRKPEKIASKSGRRMMLIGMGPGDPDRVTDEAVRAINEADVLIGAERMLQMGLKRAEHPKPTLRSYSNGEIQKFLNMHTDYRRIAFLYSGDIDVCSGAQSVRKLFSEQDEVLEIHGLSSVDYIAGICGRKREDLYLTSVHGRKADVAGLLERQDAVVCLLGGSETFETIIREIIDHDYAQTAEDRQLFVTLGERLSYPDECITKGTPRDFVHVEIDPLSVAVFEWKEPDQAHWRAIELPRVMIAAPKSGGGKTTLTCGLIRALQRRGLSVSSMKCGPDYIDPMFHASTLGVRSGNLDSFFTDAKQVRTILAEEGRGSDIAVIEGVMGYYDGLGGVSERASCREIADITGSPVILVVDAKGASVSLAPVLSGILTFHGKTRIQGVILNRVSGGFYLRLKAFLEEELRKRNLKAAILGYLPEHPAFTVPSRHLGLISPEELHDRRSWADGIADQLEKSVEIDRIVEMARSAEAIFSERKREEERNDAEQFDDNNRLIRRKVRIAVAKDEAFSFYYSENEALLQSLGAELVKFSPLHDDHFPKHIDGLILGGGYPELYPSELERNETMRHEIREAIQRGLPTIAECGGFLYLLRSLHFSDGTSYRMCGMIDADGFETAHLVRFGYVEATAKRPGLFGQAGVTLRGHEFHYWDATKNGDGLALRKPVGEKTWDAMHYTDTLAAGFPHFYYPGNPAAIGHFLKTCEAYKRRRDERDETGRAGDPAGADRSAEHGDYHAGNR